MLYLDANVFILAAQSNDEAGEKARKIISSAAEGKQCMTSVLTWDEVFWAVKKKFGRQRAAEHCKKILALHGIEFVTAYLDIILLAQKLVETYALNPRDAIHAATALKNGCKAIVSTDPDFDEIKEIKRMKL